MGPHSQKDIGTLVSKQTMGNKLKLLVKQISLLRLRVYIATQGSQDASHAPPPLHPQGSLWPRFTSSRKGGMGVAVAEAVMVGVGVLRAGASLPS